jgi:hypothetical protein
VGVWGHKVFDGDGAAEFLGDVIDQLQAVIEEGLELGRSRRRTRFRKASLVRGTSPSLHEPVAPAVAALRALVAGTGAGGECVAKAQVRRWRDAYFEWYERVYVPVNGPNARYRKNVEKEFDTLHRLAYGEDPAEVDG